MHRLMISFLDGFLPQSKYRHMTLAGICGVQLIAINFSLIQLLNKQQTKGC